MTYSRKIITICALLLVIVCAGTKADEPPTACSDALPKKPAVRHKLPPISNTEPLVQEISVECGSLVSNQVVPQTASEGKKDDQPPVWLRFIEEIVKLVGNIAWPAAAMAIAFFFKKELTTLLARLKKGKWGDAEFEFENYVREVDAETDIPRTNEEDKISVSAAARASVDPRGAIVGAWIEVEDALFSLVTRRGLLEGSSSSRPVKSPVSAIRSVQKAQALDSRWIALFHDLRALRNEAAHSTDFSPPPESVMTYVQLAKELVQAMRLAAHID